MIDIITLQTNTATEHLAFAARYLVCINFTFDLTVLSRGFGGTSHFSVRRDEIDTSYSKLLSINLTLEGTTRLEDNDSDGFIEFILESGGWLLVNGQVGGSLEDHLVRFKFRAYQTCTPKFLTDFKSMLAKSH